MIPFFTFSKFPICERHDHHCHFLTLSLAKCFRSLQLGQILKGYALNLMIRTEIHPLS